MEDSESRISFTKDVEKTDEKAYTEIYYSNC